MRRFHKAVTAAAFFGAAVFATAQPTQNWDAVFGGTGNVNDTAREIELDSNGNAYTVSNVRNGASTVNDDIRIVKYNHDGTVAWDTTYNGTAGTLQDLAGDLTIGKDGFVYVCGFSRYGGVSPDTSDAIVIKLNPATGAIVWTYRDIPTGAVNRAEFGFAVDADANGNVYFVSDMGATVQYDGAMTKLDSTGARVWQKFWNGPASDYDRLSRVQIAPNGNIYAYGRARQPITPPDTLLRYDLLAVGVQPDGTVIGSQIINIEVDDFDRVGSTSTTTPWGGRMAVDSNSNFYCVTNGVEPAVAPSTNNQWSSSVTKISANMNLQWSFSIEDSDNNVDMFPCGFVAKPDGSYMYLAGYRNLTPDTTNVGDQNGYVLKLDGSGSMLWQSSYNGANNFDDATNDVMIDQDGGAIIAGWSVVAMTGTTATDLDGYLAKFNATTGAEVWRKAYANATNTLRDVFTWVRGVGSVIYAAGYAIPSGVSTDQQCLTVKYTLPPSDIVAAGYQVNYGVETTPPGVANLQANDADTVQLCLNPDQEDPNPVQMEVSATNGNVNPASLNFNLVCRAEANDREVYVEMFSFSLGDWVGSPSFPVTDGDALYTVAAPGTAGDFVNDGDGAMITRITGFLGAADSPTLPCWDFNYCYWN